MSELFGPDDYDFEDKMRACEGDPQEYTVLHDWIPCPWGHPKVEYRHIEVDGAKGTDMRVRCLQCDSEDVWGKNYFAVKKELWNLIVDENFPDVPLARRGLLCKPCFEELLGRPIAREEYLNAPTNDRHLKHTED